MNEDLENRAELLVFEKTEIISFISSKLVVSHKVLLLD